jgi:hypothetical protein
MAAACPLPAGLRLRSALGARILVLETPVGEETGAHVWAPPCYKNSITVATGCEFSQALR